MDINHIIVCVMVFFMAIAAIDKCIGNKFNLGDKFEEGFMAMGALALAMVGVISLAPVIATVLKPVVVPVFSFLGADPAMFATNFLACDMGGFPLAVQMAQTPEAGLFAGVILGSMMGPTIVFSIPVALGIIKEEDHKFLAEGILIGIVTIPLGCLVGGLVAGYDIIMIIRNLVPVIIFAVLIALGLWLIPKKMIKGFNIFGKFVVIVITLGLAAIIIETLTGFVLIPGMAPISEGIAVIGSIAIILAGAFPMVYVITVVFKKPLLKFGKVLGMNEVAAAGMIATLANNIPMFTMLKDMDNRGKVINIAFCVSAAFVFGDHLGFVAGVAKNMIFPMIAGKLTGGISAIILAFIMTRNMSRFDAGKQPK